MVYPRRGLTNYTKVGTGEGETEAEQAARDQAVDGRGGNGGSSSDGVFITGADVLGHYSGSLGAAGTVTAEESGDGGEGDAEGATAAAAALPASSDAATAALDEQEDDEDEWEDVNEDDEENNEATAAAATGEMEEEEEEEKDDDAEEEEGLPEEDRSAPVRRRDFWSLNQGGAVQVEFI